MSEYPENQAGTQVPPGSGRYPGTPNVYTKFPIELTLDGFIESRPQEGLSFGMYVLVFCGGSMQVPENRLAGRFPTRALYFRAVRSGGECWLCALLPCACFLTYCVIRLLYVLLIPSIIWRNAQKVAQENKPTGSKWLFVPSQVPVTEHEARWSVFEFDRQTEMAGGGVVGSASRVVLGLTWS